jgi:hypothetical protein
MADCLGTSGSYFRITEVTPIFGLLYSTVMLAKNGSGYILGDFFSQIHPVTLLTAPREDKKDDMSRKAVFVARTCLAQGCQLVYFQTKNLNLGKFWKVLQWLMLIF